MTAGGDLDALFASLRARMAERSLDLLGLYDVYAEEARFGARFLAEDLARLPTDAAVLEIGAGSLLLSCALRVQGYRVCALEPIGDGFSHFAQMQKIVMEYAVEHDLLPEMMRCAGEELEVKNRFDYAFSINVMEHVKDYGLVLQRVHDALRPGATYRFMCPNYAFPYEPHFNMPTLLSRSLTERVLGGRMARSTVVVDPAGTWASLNWITVGAVRRACRQRLGIEAQFDPAVLQTFLRRAVEDAQFQSRRGPVIRWAVGALYRSGLIHLTRLLPTAILPVMDCRIRRQAVA